MSNPSDPINNNSNTNPANSYPFAFKPFFEWATPSFSWLSDGKKTNLGVGTDIGVGLRFELDQHIFKAGYSYSNVRLTSPLFFDKEETNIKSKGARLEYGYSFNRYFGFNLLFEMGKTVYGQSSDQIAIGGQILE